MVGERSDKEAVKCPWLTMPFGRETKDFPCDAREWDWLSPFVRYSGFGLNMQRNEQDIPASCSPQFWWSTWQRAGEKAFNTHHVPTTAVRAGAQRFAGELFIAVAIVLCVAGRGRGGCYKVCRNWCRGAQQLVAGGQLGVAVTIRWETVMA